MPCHVQLASAGADALDPSPMDALYPPFEPFNQGTLDVDAIHTLYFEERGNPEGIPALFLHGGPGGGCTPTDHRFFDPAKYRVVLFDQRGCGRSTPHACLENNTTWHLVDDIEKLRTHLGIEKWLVFGGSWGSTLALAYATHFPDRVSALVLRGIFLLRQKEIEWFYEDGGASRIFPDAYERFVSAIPEDERHHTVAAFHQRLLSEDAAVRLAAARAWSQWEASTLSVMPQPELVAQFGADPFAEAFARIECHYFMHGGFLKEGASLLERAPALQGIPGTLIHGRLDMITPLENAWDLSKAWPGASLEIIEGSGHSSREPGIAEALVRATQHYATLLGS